jgi:hypothetical protein
MYTMTTNASALSARWRQRQVALTGAVLAAEHQNAQESLKTAQRLSSGSVPAAYLQRAARARKAGLYSLANPAPPLPASILNAQTTRLKRSWRTYVAWKGDGSVLTLWNTAPYGRFLGSGTRKMIARPIMERIAEEQRIPRLMRIRRAELAAMQKR